MDGTFNDPRLASVNKKELRAFLKSLAESFGREWLEKFFPKRFSSSGKNVYHLKERTRLYIKRTRKADPAWRPLVRSGSMASVSQGGAKVRATVKGDTVKVSVTIPRGHPTQKYVAEEMTKLNKNEMALLMEHVKERLIAYLMGIDKSK